MAAGPPMALRMTSPKRALVASGHVLDGPDRAAPRFPPDQLERVTKEVRTALTEWDIGPETVVISGGARGADIVVCEEALARGATILLRLALNADEFEQHSVALPGTDWSERFRRLLAAADVEVLEDASSGDVFARTNAWIIETAHRISTQPPLAIVVWNGREGDGPGGTRDLVTRLGSGGAADRIRVIDPTRRAYEARQTAAGPKKLLALDGGGIRGVLTLEVLAAIEEKLRAERHAPGLVLADYFDYIGGTSTGAIIAAALAFGKPVSEVREKYATLGRKIFSKRFLPLRLRALYRDNPLTAELEDFLGRDRTLGDPELRTLLLLVLHNVHTDSPWPLSNNTKARYNRADRYLEEVSDRNLDLSLTTLIRGSTAAPVYFPPQAIRIGSNPFVFQDGGVTPFNNPALLMVLMATLPEYRLMWPAGEDRLLVVSVGTGASATIHPGLLAKQVNIVFQAKNLPSVFMNGASTAQDLACRSLGRTRTGHPIDSEIGDRLGADSIAGPGLFSYVRYNADLTVNGLKAAGFEDEKRQKRLRRLDAVESMQDLQSLGQQVGSGVDLQRDFAGFL
ncbi:MAG: patatin-like phospholipase family protein [Solirubrobacteraceae bacterium]